MVAEREKGIRAELEARLEKNRAEVTKRWPKAITTQSGLKYIVLKEGKGEFPQKGIKIKAHYSLTLMNVQKIKGRTLDAVLDTQGFRNTFDKGSLAAP